MTSLRLPRMLADAANTELRHDVAGASVSEALADLFESKPGLRNHILDNDGKIRSHVSVFVDGMQSDLNTEVGERSEIRILHAVSGGQGTAARRGGRTVFAHQTSGKRAI